MTTKPYTATYRSLDGVRQVRHFSSLAGLRGFAERWLGKDADRGTSYLVSPDGVGMVRFTGATVAEVFPLPQPSEPDYAQSDEGYAFGAFLPESR